MIITHESYHKCSIGKKAENLFFLRAQGYQVPDFFCVNETSSEEEIKGCLESRFSHTEEFSVRSSALAEDGDTASFAGQFRTFLCVQKKEIMSAIKKVMDVSGENITAYCKAHGIQKSSICMSVIVQEMVHAERSGIIFTSNPQGLLNEMVIVVGNGAGNLVVGDCTETTAYYYNRSDALHYYEQQEHAPLLQETEFQELICLAEGIEKLFGMPCDIEFSICQGKIYILQARPVTGMKTKETIVLDSSNIAESYPGITLPLTQNFVREVYYRVFKSCLLRLTHDKKQVEQVDGILQNMTDAANGRIYYRISNWYDMILFLPFSKKIIPVWQEMLGVEHKTVSTHLEHKIGFRVRMKTTVSFFSLLFTNLSKMKELDRYFTEILDDYHSLNLQNMDTASHADSKKLTEYYQELKKRVTDKWDITLVNDMYSFLFTGLLKACLKRKKVKDYETVTNQYISGISDIESLKPVQALFRLAKKAAEEGRLEALEQIRSNEDFYAYVRENPDDFTKELLFCMEEYGDRSLEELKLESRTFRTDPVLLVLQIIQYAREEPLMQTAKEPLQLKGITGFLAKRAAAGIKNREKSRLNRSRLYGIMRLLMLKIGENFCRAHRIACPEDIFWLFYEEVEAAAEDETMELKKRIFVRKQEYKKYELLPAYSRLVFAGRVWNKNPDKVKEMDYKNDRVYSGIPCSHGTVEGEVLLVTQPSAQMDIKDKILVTKMTDPGWVYFIASAKGLVAERGSLLSHTAIISRELKKPAVVGVRHITKVLKTGDYVRVDGDRGEIVILSEDDRKKEKIHEKHQ